ncbi:hypothetical protein CBR_g37959 [Chara braunii]|uniref:Integrase catalytic domain-containing protein n=1 Tax=Chara braunii TaxID=69332 RepID=A0A388LP57_CHABU|nr:hypothetical protein CBR_g37959 [Chara braunii]|eukprot:GBG84084.1 hypothetical protein CBR_g37959 [Chara braunii]
MSLTGVEATLEADGSRIRAGGMDTGMVDMRYWTAMDVEMTDMNGRIETDTGMVDMRDRTTMGIETTDMRGRIETDTEAADMREGIEPMIHAGGDMVTTPMRVAATKSARGSTSKKTDTDYVMAEKDGGQWIDGGEVIVSPRKQGVRKFLMKSSLDEIHTVEPLRRALRQPMQCSILEYLAASKSARDELQMITRNTRIPLSEEAQGAPKAETPTVAVTGVTARADRMAAVLLDGIEGVPPDKFYIHGSGAVETIINDGAVLDAVIDNGNPTKLDKLLNWPSPLHSPTEVRQFLGVVGYWRIFIRGYAEKAEPLRLLLRKFEKFYWDSLQELAMQELKDEFKEGGHVLGVPFFDDETERPFIVSTDAGPCSVGGLLSQKDAERKERPLRFESMTLNTAERNYNQFKKEVLAVRQCLDTFRHYIYGRRFILRVDPTAVASVLQKDFSLTDRTIAQWLIRIRLYDYTVERISGTKNVVADGLSRIPLEAERPIVARALTLAEPRHAGRFLVNLYEGKYRTIGLHLSGEESQESDIQRQAAQYCLRAGHLFRRSVGSGMPLRVVCDPEERQTIVAELHDGVVGGHRGVKGTYEKVRRLYSWEGQYKDVEKYCLTCEECQKRDLVKYREPLHPSYPARPGEKVHIDLVKMPKGVGNMNYVVNIRDDFTRFVDGRPIRSKTAKEVKNFVLEYLSRYGCVSKIVMDRGAEFLADEVQSVFKRVWPRVSIATAYHPHSNSSVERGHQTLIASLSKWCKGKDSDWPRYFRYAIWVDNVTVRASTGYPP